MPPSSLKGNILSSYVSQFYIAIVGILMVPLYLKHLGVEAYGLVGFFAMLQAWFQLLDVGLTPTMSREAARFRGGATDALTLRRLLRSLEGVFVIAALVGTVAVSVGAGKITGQWLKVEHLPLEEVRHCVMLMGVIVALRWVSSLYRGTITGFEHLVWLNIFNSIVATARFVLVLPLFVFLSTRPVVFFLYQLLVAVAELALLVAKTYRLLPREQLERGRVRWEWRPLRRVLKFSLSVAFAGSVWVVITQTDKLILSRMLPLSEYAYFTLAVLVASGILLISAPVSAALLPRLSRLNAEKDDAGMIQLYRNSTQLVGIAAVPATLVLVFFPEHLLWAWTGDEKAASKSASVLALYAIGNGLLAFAAFPYYLQFAKGDLKMHLIGNALFVVIFIPLLIWAVHAHGMIGAGYAWIIANLIPFVLWLPVVHKRFVIGLHVRWLLNDVLPVTLLPLGLVYLLRVLAEWPSSRASVVFQLTAIGVALSIVSAMGSSYVREVVARKWRGERR